MFSELPPILYIVCWAAFNNERFLLRMEWYITEIVGYIYIDK